MKVHHLNCGTMRMPGVALVCHVLLVETDNGLVLVDSGFGSHDCHDPAARIGVFRHVIRPLLQHAETAADQITALGFNVADVRHIVLTHLDLDHIGGLADFPHAHVHLTAAEARGAIHAPTWRERFRYRPTQWAHRPTLVEHTPDGEPWRGFTAAKPLHVIDDGIVLVPMPGHTRGHTAVAVDAGHRWVLHAGDAFYHPGTLDHQSRVPFVLRAQETLICYDRNTLRDNQSRLAELYHRRDPDLLIVCSHDPSLYQHARDTAHNTP
ncbi:metallo-beta-lactamase domain protein [Mycobacterium parascrofulaceum ATCC BAA-614]|uniref:Metallo-beta-lactamase domain protein n=1 Tax=Mycobacterium parascrofulaceum ATCC BAA-614 TaxID=525368 RepID=D5P614_9MYCO|nr:MBL fold metallo-hydrolase [Mycobacterium parascrofulaceum]EFG78500.1 metallo-beta-lactamase domain protein [Mycobacterium parascrofulaceum ATCC BAA-614]